MIGGGTILEAIKMAWEMQPNIIYVRRVVEEGIKGTINVTEKTPIDVLKYAKIENNKYHVGAGFTSWAWLGA